MTTTANEHDVRDTARSTVHVALGAAWLGTPVWCSWKAFELLFHLFGERATAAEEAEAAHWLTLGAVVAVAVPLVALLLGGRRAWVAALVVGGLVAGVFAAGVAELTPDPPPAPQPYVCQERSGGETDCPGG